MTLSADSSAMVRFLLLVLLVLLLLWILNMNDSDASACDLRHYHSHKCSNFYLLLLGFFLRGGRGWGWSFVINSDKKVLIG